MSMNLHIEINGHEISIWQTPTQISYMCIVKSDGTTDSELTGVEAKRAVHCYLQWIKYSTNGVWDNKKDLEHRRQSVNEHIIKVKTALQYAKKVRVWVM